MYGKGPKRGELLRRTIILNHISTPTKKNPIVLGGLTTSKVEGLYELRAEYLQAVNLMIRRVWQDNPILSGFRDKNQLNIELGLVRQELTADGLHSVYAEKAKLAAQTAIFEEEKRLWNRMLGRLAYIDKKIAYTKKETTLATKNTDANSEPLRLYYNIPTSIQDNITDEDIVVLKSLAKDKTKLTLAVTHSAQSGLTQIQQTIVEYSLKKALEKYTLPKFGKDEQFVCRIDVDYRIVKKHTTSNKYHQLLDEINDNVLRLLSDRQNVLYTEFLCLTPPYKGEDIKIPLKFHSRAFNQKKNGHRVLNSTISSIVLEIGPKKIVVRAVLAQPTPQPKLIEGEVVVVGCDPGLVNTMTISAWTLPAIVQGLELEKILNFNKQDAFTYLTNHNVPPKQVEELSVPILKKADKFRESINLLCTHIEKYSSRIDTRYDIIEAQVLELKQHLGLKDDELVNPKQMYNSPSLEKLHKSFFLNLERVGSWKRERRNLYRRIGEKKKHWYGFLGNIIVKYIKSLQDAGRTVVFACEKYKGKTFNKRLSQSSLCSETKRIIGKMAWNGIPAYSIPSYYGSSFCSTCWNYDPKARQREQYKCSHCDSILHADKNAASLYAKYLCDTATP